jgi:hypothetical protein
MSNSKIIASANVPWVRLSEVYDVKKLSDLGFLKFAALLFLTKISKETQQGVFLLEQKHREQVHLASKNVTMSLSLGLCLFLS